MCMLVYLFFYLFCISMEVTLKQTIILSVQSLSQKDKCPIFSDTSYSVSRNEANHPSMVHLHWILWGKKLLPSVTYRFQNWDRNSSWNVTTSPLLSTDTLPTFKQKSNYSARLSMRNLWKTVTQGTTLLSRISHSQNPKSILVSIRLVWNLHLPGIQLHPISVLT